MKLLPIITPGEILWEEFMEPLGISQYRLAKDLAVPLTRIAAIIKGKRAITPDTSLRLARYFRMSDQFFLNLQVDYDMRVARRTLEKEINKTVKPFPRPDLEGKSVR